MSRKDGDRTAIDRNKRWRSAHAEELREKERSRERRRRAARLGVCVEDLASIDARREATREGREAGEAFRRAEQEYNKRARREIEASQGRVCRCCGERLSLDRFTADAKARGGIRTICKRCALDQKREHHRSLTAEQKRLSRVGKYGLTREQFLEMFESQGRRCGLCGKVLDIHGRGSRSSCIDHDHETGVVRGIVCQRCNNALQGYEIMAQKQVALRRYIGAA